MAAPSHLIHLDDLLAWVAVQRARESGEEDPLGRKTELPLARFEDPAGWCWKASALRLMVLGQSSIVPRTMRVDYHQASIARGKDVEFKAEKFKQGTGRYKGFDLRHEEQWVESAVAFGVGDIERVQDMLQDIRQLGGLRKLAYGSVRQVEVEPWADEDAWRYRHLPATQDNMNAVGGLRSPYWDRTQHQPIIEPMWEIKHV